MRIDNIYLKNFLSHTENSVSFKGKVNVIIGHNGAGKTSIIDGIVYALYRESNRAKANNLIKLGTSSATINLTISNDNSKIIVKRNIPSGTSDILYINNSATARGAEKVTEELEKIMQMDRDVMLSTIIVRQGEIEDIFRNLTNVMKNIMKIENMEKLTESTGPIFSVLKDINSKLEYIEKSEKEYNDVKISLTDLKNKYVALNEELKDLNEKEKEINEKEKEINEKYDKLTMIQTKYNSLKNMLIDKENNLKKILQELEKMGDLEKNKQDVENKINKLAGIEQARNLFDELKRITKELDMENSDKNKLEIEISSIEKSLQRKEQISNEYLRYVEIEQLLEDLENEEKDYNNKLSEKKIREKRINDLREKLNRIKIENLDEIQKNIDELDKRISDLRTQKGQSQAELNEAEKILTGFKDIKDNKCPLCKRPLDEEHRTKLMQEANEKYAEKKKEIKDLDKKISEAQSEKDNLTRKLDNYRKNQTIYNQISHDLNDEEEKLKELEEKLKELEEKHNYYQNLKLEEKRLKQFYEEYMTLRNITEDYLNSKKQQLNNISKIIIEKKNRIDEIKTKLGNLTEQDISDKLKELNEAKNELQKINIQIGKKKTYMENLQNLQESIDQIKSDISKINFSEEEYQEVKQERENILKEQKDIISKISEIKGKLEQISISIKEKENKLTEIENTIKDKTKLENAKKKLQKLREDLGEKGLQNYIISAVKTKIENNLNEIAPMFNLAFTRISLNFDASTRGQKIKANISAYDNYGREFSIDMLSGGEKISIALALRLAIAKSLMDTVGFMILDEPTIHLDDERRKELMNVIRSSLDMVPQIIIVTHDDEILEIGDYVIRLEKRGSESKVFEEVPGND
ncbi:AAA family ATPase [Acidianus brierleyi]|uniref:DNA double-strand break repair Rad50 ATPase n=1 Tax=Acidianus brierleyi TaxID=41673 RepID=A0A2U9IBN1_9CREN|nr:AAA family ATPase [Acidianus brierleyi]AWR93436.1 AAA family ATPase [Acidianus brierleyi]